MARSKDGVSGAADWVQEAMRENVFASMAELARIAAAIYIGAKGEGLSAVEAKDVTEATMAAMLRSARNLPPEGKEG